MFLVHLKKSFVSHVSHSLSYILNGMSHGNAFNDGENSKLFRIKLELHGNRLRFMPTLSSDENDKDSFMYTIQCLIRDICSVSHQINRIAQPLTSECVAAKRTYQSKLWKQFLDCKLC